MRLLVRTAAIVTATFVLGIVVAQRYISFNSEPQSSADVFPMFPSNYRAHASPETFVKLNSSVFALGAVYDARVGNMGQQYVRVLLVARPHRTFKCRFASGTIVDGGKLYEMSENHAMKYGVYFLNCPIPPNERVSDRIEVKVMGNAAPWRPVPVLYYIPPETAIKDYKYKLTICLPFLFGKRYSGKAVVEFMELNQILGVDHFVVYLNKKDIPDSLLNVVDFYERLGLLEVSRLEIPVNPKHIWYRGQLVTITDCLYRNMGVSRYVAFQDLDEFLIPQTPNASTHSAPLLLTLKALFTKDVASVRVPSQYMKITNFGELRTLRNTIRNQYLDIQLTKCVVRPEMIFEQGIHHTSRAIQNHYVTREIDGTSLVVYHFKSNGGNETDDRIVRDYGERLQQRYDDVLKKLKI